MSEQTFHIPERPGTPLGPETYLDFHQGDDRLTPMNEVEARNDALRYAGGVELSTDADISAYAEQGIEEISEYLRAQAYSKNLVALRNQYELAA